MGTESKGEQGDLTALSFHSISFPSEWGHGGGSTRFELIKLVSIQLVSPASGDPGSYPGKEIALYSICVSIQLVSPASGDLGHGEVAGARADDRDVSIQLVSPASGDAFVRF